MLFVFCRWVCDEWQFMLTDAAAVREAPIQRNVRGCPRGELPALEVMRHAPWYRGRAERAS